MVPNFDVKTGMSEVRYDVTKVTYYSYVLKIKEKPFPPSFANCTLAMLSIYNAEKHHRRISKLKNVVEATIINLVASNRRFINRILYHLLNRFNFEAIG